MMWNEQSTQKTNSTSLTWEELVQSLPPMVVKVEDLAITEPTDFASVGYAKPEEEPEENQPERPDSKEGLGDSDEDTDETAHETDPPETWFTTRSIWGLPYPRVSRAPHTAYTKSWRYYAAKRTDCD